MNQTKKIWARQGSGAVLFERRLEPEYRHQGRCCVGPCESVSPCVGRTPLGRRKEHETSCFFQGTDCGNDSDLNDFDRGWLVVTDGDVSHHMNGCVVEERMEICGHDSDLGSDSDSDCDLGFVVECDWGCDCDFGCVFDHDLCDLWKNDHRSSLCVTMGGDWIHGLVFENQIYRWTMHWCLKWLKNRDSRLFGNSEQRPEQVGSERPFPKVVIEFSPLACQHRCKSPFQREEVDPLGWIRAHCLSSTHHHQIQPQIGQQMKSSMWAANERRRFVLVFVVAFVLAETVFSQARQARFLPTK